jgi:hypothetical protein
VEPELAFAALNVLLTVVWVVVPWRVAAIHRERTGTHEVNTAAAAPQPSPA